MERYQEVMVTLSKSVMKKGLKRPLAEKSRWRHIRLAVKPLCLRNHASEINSYYGTLLGSHCPSFRIRHIKWREAPPGGEITMTSYLAVNKTSLSWKPCIPDKKVNTEHYQEVMVSIRIRDENSSEAPLAEKSRLRHIRLAINLVISEPFIPDKNLVCITIMKSWSLSNLFSSANINFKNLSVYECC